MAHTKTYDFVIIGSGFGGSISAMRLTEKGYSVLLMERGKRFDDKNYPETDWNIRKHQWIPSLRCFGIWENTLLNGIMILHGSGVGGGSLVYANVLMEPDDKLFSNPGWRHLADWKKVLKPHYGTAKSMLGVTPYPRAFPADNLLKDAAKSLNNSDKYYPTEVAVFFNEENPGKFVPDPYFNGMGPSRKGCTHCGACMVGCRDNAKNTLDKNYLYFAEKWGAKVLPETTVNNIRPLSKSISGGARYAVSFFKTSARSLKPPGEVLARNVVVSAGAVGTNRLLLTCRDVTKSLSNLSQRLGHNVRTNSESLTGITSRDFSTDYSKGIAIGSIFRADEMTQIEAVRFPEGSGATISLLAAPMVEKSSQKLSPIFNTLWKILKSPIDFLKTKFFPGIASRSTILLTMQTVDNLMRVRLGRNIFTLFRKDLVCERDERRPIHANVAIAHRVTRLLSEKIKGIPQSMLNESLLNIPGTAHFMGGVPFGLNDKDGVIGLNCEVHNYPGLFVVDGSIMPANPGVNPTLTIAALAEYAMEQVPPKENATAKNPLMKGDTAASVSN